MPAKRLSPTGRLLRTSRLFSLPPPLPRPGTKIASSNRESDTATQHYPTHAAIETSLSSLNRGDWGLKRCLPRRFKASSTTPMIRIGDIDSINHITEFESAADYTITLRKWQEMNVPISVALPPPFKHLFEPPSKPKSVFEASLDNTERREGDTKKTRWKFKGPWLANKTDEEFQRYVQRKVQGRESDFREFLRSELRVKMSEDRKRTAIDLGEEYEQGSEKVSEGDIDAYIKDLRREKTLLHRMIEEFLDLPTYHRVVGEMKINSGGFTKTKEQVFIEQGPPRTHPAAGLSYLLTASHMHNHPIFGPQGAEPPVEGRVLIPQVNPRFKNSRALVGLAGVVALDDRHSINRKTPPRGIVELDPDIPGGTKVWYHPEHATIDPRGRLLLTLRHVAADVLAIYEGIAPQPEEGERIDGSTIKGGDRQVPFSPPTTSRQPTKQGYGLEDTDHRSLSREKMAVADVPHLNLLNALDTEMSSDRNWRT
ncbi:hypothetical protein MMC07_007301 [Pseudocyphellaria aurata]|nr:hypothetical protein [Pseudocyphellaria aurata]